MLVSKQNNMYSVSSENCSCIKGQHVITVGKQKWSDNNINVSDEERNMYSVNKIIIPIIGVGGLRGCSFPNISLAMCASHVH